MFVAYLIPHANVFDTFNLLEDGLQWIAKGETKEEAEAALRALFDKTMTSEFYDDEERERVWNQHDSYVAEV